jgi:hypothetical protein
MLPGHRELRVDLNCDHSAICKIGTKGAKYDGVICHLREIVDKALDWYESHDSDLHHGVRMSTYILLLIRLLLNISSFLVQGRETMLEDQLVLGDGLELVHAEHLYLLLLSLHALYPVSMIPAFAQ